MGIPTCGYPYVTAATMKEMRIGKGCGKSGMKDKPIAMLTNVTVNVRILSRLGSSARSLASF